MYKQFFRGLKLGRGSCLIPDAFRTALPLFPAVVNKRGEQDFPSVVLPKKTCYCSLMWWLRCSKLCTRALKWFLQPRFCPVAFLRLCTFTFSRLLPIVPVIPSHLHHCCSSLQMFLCHCSCSRCFLPWVPKGFTFIIHSFMHSFIGFSLYSYFLIRNCVSFIGWVIFTSPRGTSVFMVVALCAWWWFHFLLDQGWANLLKGPDGKVCRLYSLSQLSCYSVSETIENV